MSGKPPGFVHTPYRRGRAKPFTIGMTAIDPGEWIEADSHLPRYLDEKERLIASNRDAVFRAEDDTREAQAEVLALLADHLPARFPEFYERAGSSIAIRPAGRRLDLAGAEPPLLTAARLVQEDLVVMRKGPQGHRFVAGAVAFPSSWSIEEKFGKTLDGLHMPVPGYADLMAQRVNRIFDNLKAEQPVARFGWSLYADDHLRHDAPRPRPAGWPGTDLGMYIRLERQTLRRLPLSGDVLFTIRIYVDPVDALRGHPDGAELAAGILRDVSGLNEPQLRYRSLWEYRDDILAELRAIAGDKSV